MSAALFCVHIPLEEPWNIYQSRAFDLLRNGLSDWTRWRGQTATIWLKTSFMPWLAVCSRDLHWHWINWTLLCDTMEVLMLRLAWLTIAQHVFQPALTGRLELISQKIVSRVPGTKAIAVSRFCEKLSPANWVQGATAILPKISRSWAPKMGSNMRPRYIQFRDIHDRYISGLHCILYDILTLNVRGPSYLGLARSISWLLMPWLLSSPGHQQP